MKSEAAKITRVGAAAFALGLSLAGPQALGVAAADTPDSDTSVTSGPVSETTAGNQPVRSDAARTGQAPRTARTAHPAAAADTPTASRTTAVSRAAARTHAAADRITRPETDTAAASRPREAIAAQAVTATTATNTTAANNPVPDTRTPAPADEAPAAVVTISAPAGVPEQATPAATASLTAASTAGATATSSADLFSGLLAPAQSFIEGIGLLIRRTFFNQAPTVAPIQTTGQLTGSITGTVGAVDPEGDPLTYALTEAPRYGAVAIGSDGSYVYTPGPDFTGLDSFNVAVIDTGFHFNLLDPSRPASTEAYLQVAQNASAPVLTFTFVYGSGSQYWSTEARNALQDSAALLATYLVVSSPTAVVYTVTGENAPASGTLASAGSDLSAPGSGFFATVVQKKIQTGVDANGAAADGEITWNFGNPWEFGTTVDTSQYDFESTAMHELLHTFGFLSFVDRAGTNTGRSWTTFDQYLVTADGTRVITDSYRWNTAYNSTLTGGLYFDGPGAVAVYGGVVPLYTPDPWESGSSVSHLDDDTFTGANSMLMNAATDTGPGIRVISPVELAILKDLGYTVTNPVPVQALVLLGFGLLRRRRGRDQRPVS